jgi:hypothetical protein
MVTRGSWNEIFKREYADSNWYEGKCMQRRWKMVEAQ